MEDFLKNTLKGETENGIGKKYVQHGDQGVGVVKINKRQKGGSGLLISS